MVIMSMLFTRTSAHVEDGLMAAYNVLVMGAPKVLPRCPIPMLTLCEPCEYQRPAPLAAYNVLVMGAPMVLPRCQISVRSACDTSTQTASTSQAWLSGWQPRVCSARARSRCSSGPISPVYNLSHKNTSLLVIPGVQMLSSVCQWGAFRQRSASVFALTAAASILRRQIGGT